MSAGVICQGCGQLVPVPDGYARNKIQCPFCGVICPVTESARQAAPASTPAARPRPAAEPSFEDAAYEELTKQAGPTFAEPAPPPAPAAEQRGDPALMPELRSQPKETLFPCRRCGRPVRRQRECPVCDAEQPGDDDIPAPVIPDLSLDDTAPDEEDPSPYAVEGGDIPTCPECRKEMAPGAVVCVACGFHLRKRKKVAKTYEPIQRQWETNYSFHQRLSLFLVLDGLALAFMMIGGSVNGAVLGWFISWLLLSGMLAFLIGTYERIELTRSGKGLVKLTSTWRAFFVPLRPVTTEVRGFEGIVSGRSSDTGFWEWFLFINLLVCGVVPGLLWYYFAIHKLRFHAALARNHGYPEVYLYRGWHEAQMKEIATAFASASGLRWDRS